MSLTNEDVERFDSIMDAVLQRREDRGMNTPERDEEKIAEILHRTSVDDYDSWLYSTEHFGTAVKFQPPANNNDNCKKFPQLDRYRNFTGED